MDKDKVIKYRRIRRKLRVRRKIFGTPDRPRLNVYRSNKHIYAQVIDDLNGHTLAQVSTLDKDLRNKIDNKALGEKSKEVGLSIAKKCISKGITKAVLDKNRFAYHGCIKNLAEGAREGGLKF
ncbi:50S ribosomal protein L18 [candidate division WOR-3 bacterium]|nr:50S ribosomal protein L18 [candidate division WOR-3 bacterium]